MDPYGEAFEEIARVDDEAKAHELGLVVLSQGFPYWVLQDEAGFHLIVEVLHAEPLIRQLEMYERESAHWPPPAPSIPEEGESLAAAMVWVLLMVSCYGVSLQWPALFVWGKVSADAVMNGDLYRVVTALFLHADIGHLMGNLVFGGLFLHLVARHLGNFWAWVGVLLAGAFGNYLNAAIYYPEPHYSVGASTAVFGAVGMLATLPVGFWLRHARRKLASTWAVPIIVGMIFLAWFGTGNERTDTSAHLMGFLCGLPLGLAGGYFRETLVS